MIPLGMIADLLYRSLSGRQPFAAVDGADQAF